MQYIGQYCKQFFKSVFHRKFNLSILQEHIQNNPKGLFVSIFKTDEQITKDEMFGKNTEINYSVYHLFFGNSEDNIAHITSSDLPHKYQNIAHHRKICNFENLSDNIKQKIIVNSENISEYKKMKLALALIEEKLKIKFPTFDFPSDASFYNNLSILFFKNKVSLDLTDKTDNEFKKTSKL